MREYICRGKRKDNGEWIVGTPIIYEDGRTRIIESHTDIFCYVKDSSIIQTVAHEVDPETVDQWTGLTDKNDKKIFEGDIVEIDGKHYEVKYMLGQFFVGINTPIAYKRFDCEVIGNIHDNPELLQMEE